MSNKRSTRGATIGGSRPLKDSPEHSGKQHPAIRLEARRKDYRDSLAGKNGYRSPGSVKK